jgi:hypothetical protein
MSLCATGADHVRPAGTCPASRTSGYAALKGNRLQVAPQIVAPRMVDTLEVRSAVAFVVQTDQCATMGAAIFESGDRAILGTGDHFRHLADYRRPPSPVGDLRLQAQIVPDGPLEHTPLFGLQRVLLTRVPPSSTVAVIGMSAGCQRSRNPCAGQLAATAGPSTRHSTRRWATGSEPDGCPVGVALEPS